ncbi:MAG: 3-methyl-2-oxobutanoate hydroxymethyltransferase, partial [Desulfobulbaceae bacterium]|nr:3-methyl-2-oxobutanoate hydroxymethyltransferase [Desulfobulbaceae bacterium]
MSTKKLTVFDIRNMKASGDRIVALTAFDAGSAALLDQAGVDIILVGDSLAMVVLGYES